ncbi:MAG TPA: hypothetical protein VKE49_12370, partial [Myxococcaceae bacterium]|nr:hypothetical protein [Myxococcaceae bacterium]
GVEGRALNGLHDGVQVETRIDPLTSWIASDPELKAERLELAHYIVQCAMAPGDDRIVQVDG